MGYADIEKQESSIYGTTGRRYAQILKSTSRVNLIGGMELGIYNFDLPLAYTVDITNRQNHEDIQIGMVHDREQDVFLEYVPLEPVPEPEPVEELTDEQAAIYQTQLDVAYIKCLVEIQTEGGIV